jgi:hypothetical protein
MISLNPLQDLDWKEFFGEEERYHHRHRELPLTSEQLVHMLEVARAKYTPKGGRNRRGPITLSSSRPCGPASVSAN